MPSDSTVIQTQTIADSKPDWDQLVSFAQFDPSLGTLVDVRIGITGDVDSTASIENLGAAAASVGLSVPVTFEVFSPDNTEQGYVEVSPTTTVNLGRSTGPRTMPAVPAPWPAGSPPAAPPWWWIAAI